MELSEEGRKDLSNVLSIPEIIFWLVRSLYAWFGPDCFAVFGIAMLIEWLDISISSKNDIF